MTNSFPKRTPMAWDFEQVLDLLACPACLHSLHTADEALVCTSCGRRYPVLDGIPILLIDRATRAE